VPKFFDKAFDNLEKNAKKNGFTGTFFKLKELFYRLKQLQINLIMV